MQSTAPALAPLFRSRHQLRLLGELFLGTGGPFTVHELAARSGMHPSTASREVTRLARHGLVSVQSQGRNRLVQPNTAVPFYRELRALLAQTIGPPALLSEAVGGLGGIEHVYIFGSWAARYAGEPGPFPRDLDVLVVGEVDFDRLYAACRAVEAQIHLDVNPTVITEADWQHPPEQSFISQVKAGPLVAVSPTCPSGP